jgi:isopenicillin-N epimerase
MTNTRRSFLGGLTGAAAGLTYLPSAVASPIKLKMLLATVTSNSESYWKLVTEQYPVRPGKVILNAANLCPAPRSVSDRVAELTRDEDSDVSFPNRAKFDQFQEESRHKIAGFFGVSPDEIALVRNTSEANNTINNGYALTASDEIVLWDQNHPCNNAAWDVRQARYGFKISRVNVPSTVKSNEEIVKLFEAAVTPRTKLLSITHISNSSGARLPAKEIFAMAKAKVPGIYCHLDGAQTFGYLKLDLKDVGCDSYAGSCHKWFMGPKQVGILYVRQEQIQRLWPNIVSVGYNAKADTPAKGARKFECLGQRDDASIAAVGTAVDFHHIVGQTAVEARTTELATALKQGVAKINKVKMITPMDPKLSGGIVIFGLADFDRKQTAAFVNDLYVKYGVAGAPTGGVRLCPHTYNTMDDVDTTIRAVRELLG